MSGRGVRVPAGVREVVDVRFDGERIWSFNPRREQTRPGQRWVRWPRDLEPYLDGVAEVSLVEHVSGERVLEKRVGFGTGTSPIRLVDKDGHAVALDKAGHLQRMFAGTDPVDDRGGPRRRGTGAARPPRGVRARGVPGLRLPARRRSRRPRDRPRLRRGRVLPEPAHAPVRHHQGEQAGRRHHGVAGLADHPDVRRRLQDLDPARGRPPGGHRRLRRLLRRRRVPHGALRDRRPGPLRPAPRRRGDARGQAFRRPGPTRGPAGGDLRTRLAGARPVVRVRPLARHPPAPERLAAQQPQEPALLGRLLPVATERPGAHHPESVRDLGGRPAGAPTGTSSTSGAATGATRSTSPSRVIGSPRWTARCWRAA